MNGSTVVIIPPSGDMKAYIESLQLLLQYPLKFIAPGHGDVMPEPVAVSRLAGQAPPAARTESHRRLAQNRPRAAG
jgi:glyoxylase-like metal-dependent hydrolase (beta-lactamase superfamily II)